MFPSLQSSTRRRRRVALVVPVCLVAGSLGVSSQAAASAPDESRVLASSVATTTSASTTKASTVTSPLIGTLLRWLTYRGTRIVGNVTIGIIRDYGRQRLINWYCSTWHRYFGYDYSYWRWAANYYFAPRWAWNFCYAYWR